MSSIAIFFFGFLFGIAIGYLLGKKRAEKVSAEDIKLRVQIEDALKKFYYLREPIERKTLEKILSISEKKSKNIWDKMLKNNLINSENNRYSLSERGRQYALKIIRAHRLWEEFLAQKTGYPPKEWHRMAEYKEHFLSQEELSQLERTLGYPLSDPHGDPIPSQRGELRELHAIPLTEAPPNTPLRVVHIEDEPQDIYQKLLEKRIFPGEILQILQKNNSDRQLILLSSGKELNLQFQIAENIFVELASLEENSHFKNTIPLSRLKLGETAEIAFLSPAIFGLERRRLLDLGILPGTKITPELTSPLADPRAYRVRDSLIALRREQADQILVKPIENSHQTESIMSLENRCRNPEDLSPT